MQNLIHRTIGLCVIFSVLVGTAWSGYYLYQLTFRGQKQFVVMPEGTAGVVPGSAVQYEGIMVGEVTETTPLVNASSATKKNAFEEFRQKKHLFQEEEKEQPEDQGRHITESPDRMALVTLLLKDASIPVGPRTYASGSAYYITGQGYITLKNRRPIEKNDDHPTFIPSSVRIYWMESYVNLAMSIAPLFERVSELHNRVQNWYHASEASNNGGQTGSGRDQLDELPRTIDSWNEQARTLDRQLQSVKGSLNTIDSSLQEIMNTLPASRMNQNWSQNVNEINQSTKQQLGSIQQGVRNDLMPAQNPLETIKSQIEFFESDTLREGLID